MSSRTLWRHGTVQHGFSRSPSPPPPGDIEWLPAHEISAAATAYSKRTNTQKKRRRHNAIANRKSYIHSRQASQNGAMDALASTALASGPASPYYHHYGASSTDQTGDSERPPKRVKSEAFITPSDNRDGQRPTTSYTRPPPDLTQPTLREDAELLLNLFTSGARTTSTKSPSSSHNRSVSFGQTTHFPSKSFQPTSQHGPLPQYESVFDGSGSSLKHADETTPTANTHNRRQSSSLERTPGAGIEGDKLASDKPPLAQAQAMPHVGHPTAAHEGPGVSSSEHPIAYNAEDTGSAYNPRATPSPEERLNVAGGLHGLPRQKSPNANPASDFSTLSQRTEGQKLKDSPEQEVASANHPQEQTSTSAPIRRSDQPSKPAPKDQTKGKDVKEQICTACGFHRNHLTLETENEMTSWISCDGCNDWFHFACAGFKSEREVRSVDKFRCKSCKPIHGSTTYVRKSARAHAAIDYAELNQGVVKTSEESPEHHYIKPIKEGTIKFTPETFARIRPELITSDFWLHGEGMKEPVVIPAEWNPQPRRVPRPEDAPEDTQEDPADDGVLHDQSGLESEVADQFEYEQEPDDGQDALGMVIPRHLTVRRVAELYGPEEKIEVIDVKSQNGEDKRWNMRKWTEYYESTAPDKPVRNVISLEVSQSKLGKLIMRPKAVRELDLQDSVWPQELMAKGDYPKVQFYCLMSVADCYTDFHIDFGGSSVYYHILKGKKTFFFIPPSEANLKKYEDWCNSDAQNYTFLGDQTKVCYRVDLGPGDTMLIPAGWIHAVWTPEDSLVIGGNFLTRQNYSMQIRITQIEKATGVARKFRYPHFQKLMWYTIIKYMNDDPLPQSVAETLLSGKPFHRDVSTWQDYDAWGVNSSSDSGTEHCHARYYPKCELDGLPELARYIQRTAYIAAGFVTDGVSSDTKRAVQRSIPKEYKQHGSEPVDCVRKFAMWYCWKRGNELLPHWAYSDYIPEANAPEVTQKKLSAAHLRRLEREAAMSAERVSDRPQREKKQPANLYNEMMAEQEKAKAMKATSPVSMNGIVKQPSVNGDIPEPAEVSPNRKDNQSKRSKPAGSTPSRQPACEACRRGRRACKHRDFPQQELHDPQVNGVTPTTPTRHHRSASNISLDDLDTATNLPAMNGVSVSRVPSAAPDVHVVVPSASRSDIDTSSAAMASSPQAKEATTPGRSKACSDCRKSKRRCIHDEFGRQDPVKMAQAAQPRPAAKKKRLSDGSNESKDPPKKSKKTLPSSPKLPQYSAPGDQLSETQTEHIAAPTESTPTTLSTAPQQPTPILQSETLSQRDNILSQNDGIKIEETSSLPQGSTSSALVSPPESTHTDERTASPAPAQTLLPAVDEHRERDAKEPLDSSQQQDRNLTPPTTASAPRSRRSSQLPTKPSDASNDNVKAVPSIDGADADTKMLDNMLKRRAGSNAVSEADEETQRLIREMTAQDRGLRRR